MNKIPLIILFLFLFAKLNSEPIYNWLSSEYASIRPITNSKVQLINENVKVNLTDSLVTITADYDLKNHGEYGLVYIGIPRINFRSWLYNDTSYNEKDYVKILIDNKELPFDQLKEFHPTTKVQVKKNSIDIVNFKINEFTPKYYFSDVFNSLENKRIRIEYLIDSSLFSRSSSTFFRDSHYFTKGLLVYLKTNKHWFNSLETASIEINLNSYVFENAENYNWDKQSNKIFMDYEYLNDEEESVKISYGSEEDLFFQKYMWKYGWTGFEEYCSPINGNNYSILIEEINNDKYVLLEKIFYINSDDSLSFRNSNIEPFYCYKWLVSNAKNNKEIYKVLSWNNGKYLNEIIKDIYFDKLDTAPKKHKKHKTRITLISNQDTLSKTTNREIELYKNLIKD